MPGLRGSCPSLYLSWQRTWGSEWRSVLVILDVDLLIVAIYDFMNAPALVQFFPGITSLAPQRLLWTTQANPFFADWMETSLARWGLLTRLRSFRTGESRQGAFEASFCLRSPAETKRCLFRLSTRWDAPRRAKMPPTFDAEVPTWKLQVGRVDSKQYNWPMTWASSWPIYAYFKHWTN